MSTHQPANQGRNSPRWAFMEKFVIPDVTTGEPYLKRWRILQTPWFGIMLHKILLPDGDETPHNHPYAFSSLIIKGGYLETRTKDGWLETTRLYPRWKRNDMPLDVFHRISYTFKNEPVWTLIVHGPRKQQWGFLTKTGFVESSEYFARNQ